ncbi:hypothetical protein IVB27_23570 [Bradyrhizobium sp. 197]|jgi:hypothetical protein|uniref:hypothetical protein n=1 Tax=Bradyrhizobium sp. 197 TaxID=2782663 RepID=UPI001FFADA26|nr:hypothetical protein [Bradyrhizobium sp. 197]MCK1477704.1 hypothetical protein [Bradyrhizobium sp. 197]
MTHRLIDQAPDMFVGELARIDSLGANQRLIFSLPTIDGDRYSTVQIKLIVPADYMVTLGALILGHARQDCEDSKLARMEIAPGARAN